MASARDFEYENCEYEDNVFYESGEESVSSAEKQSTTNETAINVSEDIMRKFNLSVHSTPEKKKEELFSRFINNSVEYKNTGWEQVQKYKRQADDLEDNDLNDYLELLLQNQLPENNPDTRPLSPPPKRGRGRPKKIRPNEDASTKTIQPSSSPNPIVLPVNETPTNQTKRGRGRPRKIRLNEENPTTSGIQQQQKMSQSSQPLNKIIRLRDTSSEASDDSMQTSILATPICKKFVFFDQTNLLNSNNENKSANSGRKTSTPNNSTIKK